MVKCNVCGKENGDSTFCSNCGSNLSTQNKVKTSTTQEKKFCTNCGNEINVNATFCPHCGTSESNLSSHKVGNNLVPTFNPGTAFLLSLYTTGAGHIYLGLFKRGISFLLTQVVLIVLIILFTVIFSFMLDVLGMVMLLIGILLFIGLHIYSIYDAYKSIKQITNGENVGDTVAFNNLL